MRLYVKFPPPIAHSDDNCLKSGNRASIPGIEMVFGNPRCCIYNPIHCIKDNSATTCRYAIALQQPLQDVLLQYQNHCYGRP